MQEANTTIDWAVGPEFEMWVRPPKNGQRLEGLSRSLVYQLVDDPSNGIVSISLRRPGTSRGCRLIGLRSLRTYLARLAAEQNSRQKRQEAAGR
jgi:hypothetical protein